MKKEHEYTEKVNSEHLKAFGQYFTPPSVAAFMCSWACENARTVLDPAVGNSVFLTAVRERYQDCTLTGYEIDPVILDFFGNPAGANLKNTDYLLNDWETTYDAIVCNPPYNRFQAVPNRNEIIDTIYRHTGHKYSTYTNLYALFLIKSLYQLSPTGRLAYIIPSEFLNSEYGTVIKEKLVRERLLTAIINFKNDRELFDNATTTGCILLADRTPKDKVLFYSLESVKDIENLPDNCLSVRYTDLVPSEKWRTYLSGEASPKYNHLVNIGDFCEITRGIATGANDYFCMSRSEIERLGLPMTAFTPCICRSADVKSAMFRSEDFTRLSEMDKTVYLLDIRDKSGAYEDASLSNYIAYGESLSVHQKYLVSRRNPWYSMEQRPIAPIWVSTACRKGLKFIRNLAGINSLTAFHSVYLKETYREETDIIFCYFLTPIAQDIIRKNRKELGNGLEKFQPSDIRDAQMLDITLLSQSDRERINTIYREMTDGPTVAQLDELNRIFLPYLTVS